MNNLERGKLVLKYHHVFESRDNNDCSFKKISQREVYSTFEQPELKKDNPLSVNLLHLGQMVREIDVRHS